MSDEPVFIRPDHLALARKSPFLCQVGPVQVADFVPLYTKPESARKPMTVIEIDDALKENVPECSQDYEIGFHAGARWAEQRLSK